MLVGRVPIEDFGVEGSAQLIREALRVTHGEEEDQQSWKGAVAALRELEILWVGDWDSTEIICYSRGRRDGP